MLTSSFARWLVTVSMAVLLQLCCCKMEKMVCALSGHLDHQVRAGGGCCAGETGADDDDDGHEDLDHVPAVVRNLPQDGHHHDAPEGPCKCSCDSRLSYADNSRVPDLGWLTWATLPVISSRLVLVPIERSETLRPEVRCRDGPAVSLSILHCVLLV